MHNRIELFLATLLGFAAIISVSAQALDSPSTTPAQGANLPIDAQGDGRQQALDLATTASVKDVENLLVVKELVKPLS